MKRYAVKSQAPGIGFLPKLDTDNINKNLGYGIRGGFDIYDNKMQRYVAIGISYFDAVVLTHNCNKRNNQ